MIEVCVVANKFCAVVLTGSLDLAEKKVSQYLATGSIGQNAPGAHRDHQERGHEHYEGSHNNHGQERLSGSSSKKGGDNKDGRDHRAEVRLVWLLNRYDVITLHYTEILIVASFSVGSEKICLDVNCTSWCEWCCFMDLPAFFCVWWPTVTSYV